MSFYLSCDWLPHECKANTLWCVISVASRSSALRNDQFYYFFSLRKKIPHDEKTRKHQRVLVSFYSCCDWLPCDCAAILFDASLWSYNNCALWQSTNFIFFSSLKKKIRELKKTRKHRRVWMTFYSCCGHRTSVKLILFYRPLWSYNNWALWRITNFIFILFFGVSIVILKLKMNGHRHVSCCVPYKRQWRKFRSR